MSSEFIGITNQNEFFKSRLPVYECLKDQIATSYLSETS